MTGCGKSTLMSLMMGEIMPKIGKIKIAGRSIKNMAILNALRLIACVSQDDALFTGSLAENISFLIIISMCHGLRSALRW